MLARDVALTNVTGDDVVVSAFVEDDLLEPVNEGIVNLLRMSAENLGDLSGISPTPENAGEGVSYAEASIRPDRYPDAIVLGFDTYGGEPFVGDVANSAIDAAKGMKNLTDVSDYIEPKTRKIPGVGYVSPETDDPVVVATIEDIASKGYDLSPNKYVEYHREEIRPYADVKAEFLAAYENLKRCEARFAELING